MATFILSFIILSLSLKINFTILLLSEKNNLAVDQSFLLSITSFMVRLIRYSFFPFRGIFKAFLCLFLKVIQVLCIYFVIENGSLWLFCDFWSGTFYYYIKWNTFSMEQIIVQCLERFAKTLKEFGCSDILDSW